MLVRGRRQWTAPNNVDASSRATAGDVPMRVGTYP